MGEDKEKRVASLRLTMGVLKDAEEKAFGVIIDQEDGNVLVINTDNAADYDQYIKQKDGTWQWKPASHI